jgi:preprotein translocase subunit SecY
MFNTFINVFKISELRNKILFTIAMLAVFRLGHWIPIPGLDQAVIEKHFQSQEDSGSAAARLTQFVTLFSGGNMSRSTIFGLGVMPYISAGIIFQLLGTALPALKKMQEEGPTGRQKIQEWTRYGTVALAVVQGFGWLKYMTSSGMVYHDAMANPVWWAMALATLVAGTVFLMWIGEQIDRFGIGNGVSMIIMAGILTGMPGAVQTVISDFDPGQPDKLGWAGVLMIIAGFFTVVGGAVLMTVAQRRIPIQQAKHTRGRRVFGGQRSYLPLRINHGGVMPVVFASSLMIFPSVILTGLQEVATARANAEGTTGGWGEATLRWFSINLQHGELPYVLIEVAMIFFFSYFWITVQFNPQDMSKQLKEAGSFIPGLRPGPRTEEYLETVMTRVTFVGAAFLSVIAVLPMVVSKSLGIQPNVAQFLGGTGLLIVVSVCMDFLQRVEANLLMRNYAGFLSGDGQSGPRFRGPRG